MSEKESSSPWSILARDIVDVYRTLLDGGMQETGAITITQDIAREMIHMVVNNVTTLAGMPQSSQYAISHDAQAACAPFLLDQELIDRNAQLYFKRRVRETLGIDE